MSAVPSPLKRAERCFPDSDGQPMADNTLQFEWITTIKWGLDVLFADRPDVFVAGDHLIYAVDDEDVPGVAPDVYAAFGRPKGHRGSYKVWEEGGTFPQVIFEVWSPGNRQQQMEDKRAFYERHGAEEYYIVYPEFPAFVEGWVRKGDRLERVPDMKTWVSPRLGIRFEVRRGLLSVIRPDGMKFLNYVELDRQLADQRRLADQEKERAETEKQRAEAEKQRAETEKQRAEQEWERAERERASAAQEKERAEKLAAKLRELGLDPDAV
jgi:Uma2 family endonuclease